MELKFFPQSLSYFQYSLFLWMLSFIHFKPETAKFSILDSPVPLQILLVTKSCHFYLKNISGPATSTPIALVQAAINKTKKLPT